MTLATVAVAWTFAQAAEDAPAGAASKPATVPSDFSYTLPQGGMTSAGVFDADGRLVRTLWRLTSMPAGKHAGVWDGMTDLAAPADPGSYEVRVVLNNGTYQNVGVIGNTGQPPTNDGHIPGNFGDLCVNDAGLAFTANGWEEGGHDFKVFAVDGSTAFHANYAIRNGGDPNGGPYALIADDEFLYCSVEGWWNDNDRNRQQIQRFSATDGKRVPFTDESLKKTNGHIELYEWPQRQVPEGTSDFDRKLMTYPLRALAVHGDNLFCADALGGKVYRFDKTTGKKLGEFDVKLPHALAADSKGQVWVGHEHSKVSVFSAEGKPLGTPISDAKFVKALRFGPKDKLILTDGNANQVRFYDVTGATAKLASTFGGPAKLGDYAPDRFYGLAGADMDAKGNLVVAQVLSAGGARITRFDAADANKVLWDHVGMDLCALGTYHRDNPDEIITQRLARFALDRKKNTWEYRGSMLDGDGKFCQFPHGTPRLVKIKGNTFFYQAYGDGMQVYRRVGDTFKQCTMVGGIMPLPDGTFNQFAPKEKQVPGVAKWTWSDASGDGVKNEKTINMFKDYGPGEYRLYGMNVDNAGNLLYCEHHSYAVHELPLVGLDAKGNPMYDWAKSRQLVERDFGPAKLFPVMAVRAEDGSLYVLGAVLPGSDSVFTLTRSWSDDAAWMAGNLMARYDKDGNRLWVIQLPKKCTGLDVIPASKDGRGGGVATGHFETGQVYHINSDGLVIGQVGPGEAAGNFSGWLDNTGAVVANRDKDGVIDLFVEDSLMYRFLWHRVDDKNMQTVKVKVVRR